MNKYILIAAVLAVMLIGGAYGVTQTSHAPIIDVAEEAVVGFQGQVTSQEFQEKIDEGYIVLDIRTPQEYQTQRISDDALSINFYDADFKEQLGALDKNKKYVLHCKSGGRSGKAVQTMKVLGFTEFYELQGGIDSWSRKGLPTVRGQKAVTETDVVGSVPTHDAKPDKIPPVSMEDGETEITPALPVMCTADAMECPDGSYVGRTGPNCEFVCPQGDVQKKPQPKAAASSKKWWHPTVGLAWQWQLSGDIDTSYDVDVYDIDLEETPQSVIDALHADGVKVVCYISAGSWEDWRSDADAFPQDSLGKDYEGWPGEKWLNVAQYQLFADVMLARLDSAVEKKCDAIEPDNIHGYQEDTGFEITYADQLRYNRWLAQEAHKRGLAIALKNDGEQTKDLIEYYDFAIVEECFQWGECDSYSLFVKEGKAVLGVEYELSRPKFCLDAEKLQFSWLEMEYSLDGGRKSCDDVSL